MRLPSTVPMTPLPVSAPNSDLAPHGPDPAPRHELAAGSPAPRHAPRRHRHPPGTLTAGDNPHQRNPVEIADRQSADRPRLVGVLPIGNFDENELLRLVA